MARRQPEGFELAHNKHPTKGASFKDLRRRKNRRRGKQSLRVWYQQLGAWNMHEEVQR